MVFRNLCLLAGTAGFLCLQGEAVAGKTPFVAVRGLQFEVDGRPHYVAGTNFWQGMNLGADLDTGDRAQLIRELDRLKAYGIDNLRVMAASEGPDGTPFRMVPALMKEPGVYDEAVFQGLDFLLAELDARGMRAVMVLNNFWAWSGGMAQYVKWADPASQIPIPFDGSSSWDAYIAYAARFYSDPTISAACQAWYLDHITTVLSRVNSMNGRVYRDDPTIFSWELANEPRLYPQSWIDATSAFIHGLDPNHMVTVGSEGTIGGDFVGTHLSPGIDYATLHVWVENWGHYNPSDPSDASLANASSFALGYLQNHERMAREVVQKPLVLEEFGIARNDHDGVSKYDPAAATTHRDSYYATMFAAVHGFASDAASPVAGANFWAWSGESRASGPNPSWIGDPPHEPAGWYSVYDTDASTLLQIRGFAQAMAQLSSGAPAPTLPACTGDTGSDPDRDGRGVENGAYCALRYCGSAAVDADRDGFGSEGKVECRVPRCLSTTADADGDGWGWERAMSCIASVP